MLLFFFVFFVRPHACARGDFSAPVFLPVRINPSWLDYLCTKPKAACYTHKFSMQCVRSGDMLSNHEYLFNQKKIVFVFLDHLSSLFMVKSVQHFTCTHAWFSLLYDSCLCQMCLLFWKKHKTHHTWECFCKFCLGIHVGVMQRAEGGAWEGVVVNQN